MRKLILASSSPRRRELMSLAELEYDICIKNVDETVPEGTEPSVAAKSTAEKKASAVFDFLKNGTVIGADTIVVLDGQILGKPKDKEDAYNMLRSLSGRKHKVITGVCVINSDTKVLFHEESTVTFYELSEAEIKHYVSTGEPMDKAGAYGIQGKGCTLIKEISGDYYNIVGLPIARLVRELKKLEEKE